MKRSWSSESNEESGAYDTDRPGPRGPFLSSLKASVSPPPRKPTVNQHIRKESSPDTNASNTPAHSLAAIEAGQVEINNHLATISTKLSQCIRPLSDLPATPRLPIDKWIDLYRRNEDPQGHHFVIHQHDHPVAGTHYDLRLQFSETSSVSWSIMYGLPGDPNSQRLNRNATETRVHCLWNHLIETASSKTGSMIIWDTGEYEVLPYNIDQAEPETDDSRTDVSDDPISVSPSEQVPDSVKLHEAFNNRKIRLRLHGTRLPTGYTIALRMDKSTDFVRPIRDGPKRRRRAMQIRPKRSAQEQSTSSSESPPPSDDKLSSLSPSLQDERVHSDNDDTDLQIQQNNAYPGSFNTIGSIHQRRWYLSLDRFNSGFAPPVRTKEKKWTRRQSDTQEGPIVLGFEPFYVCGPEIERSVVTGRLGADVLEDEGVDDFVRRRGWRAVLN
ncbi:hypothetical protein N7474_008363 [Penicillium riverlandense]|uniref:uncharacterized protein n=1 Tax=Penicillium riverlandense TaxID=1903569 RepID=UPI002547B47A|nr:uncharacterized protein N7474_008363 [Penicillium riverlandense]KAJ5812062.1 hypothetical protein N7474_008363 [Penicillium riverlandense]